ncbi:MAG: hypothetical protein ABI693_18940 [Bryobacteraceae bacterium]
MANTTIQVVSSGSGMFSASPDSAPFHPGDTVTFVAAEGVVDALICFSDNASDVLTPQPGGSVALSAGAPVTFTVTGATEGGCCAAIVSAGHDGAPSCPGAPAGILPVTTMGRRPVPSAPIRN